MGTEERKFEAVVAEHAARRHGVVTHAQLLRLGFTARVIRARVASGYLIPVHRGVYVVGHLAVAPLAYEAAAVLACAPRALVGGCSAALMWELPVTAPDEIEVLVVGRRLKPRAGLRVRCISQLGPGEMRRIQGIPVASPALTLLDVAGSRPEGEFARALNEARVKRGSGGRRAPLMSETALLDTALRHPTRAGSALIRKSLRAEHWGFQTESEAEARCLRLMIAHELEPDESQAQIGPYRVDFLYREERLVVEVDGYVFHASHPRFVADRRRVTGLLDLGYAVFPITWADLVDLPDETMERLRRVLLARRAELRASPHESLRP